MGWILTCAILLIATAAVMTRRLRSHSGHGDLRFCLLITLSTIGWSLIPALHSLPVMAGCMLLASLPLAMPFIFGTGDDLAFTTVALLGSLLVMLLALAALAHGCFGLQIGHALITVPHAASAWGGMVVVLFITPMLFWAGGLPLIWWYGNAAGDAPASTVLFLLLVPAIGSSAAYLRIMHHLIFIAPAAANVVTLTVIGLGAGAVVAYGVKALVHFAVPDILGNIVGIFMACTFVTLAAGISLVHVAPADLVGCVLLYALAVGTAIGSSVGIFGRKALGIKQQWPSFARVKPLHALLLLVALLSLGGLPPTLGSIARVDLFLAVGRGTVLGLIVLGINALGLLLGSGAVMRVGTYALMGMPEIDEPQPATDKRRKRRRLTAGLLLLLTAAGILNALALLAYNPIQQLAASFAPSWVAR